MKHCLSYDTFISILQLQTTQDEEQCFTNSRSNASSATARGKYTALKMVIGKERMSAKIAVVRCEHTIGQIMKQ